MSKVSDIATIALVGGLGVGAYALYKNSDKIGQALGDVGNILNPAGLFDTLGSTLGSFFDGLLNNDGGSSTNDLGNKLPELSPNRLFPDEGNISDKTKLEVIETIFPGSVSILPGFSGVEPIAGAPSIKSIVDIINEATLNRASTPINPTVGSAAAADSTPITENREAATMTTKIDTSAYSVDKDGKPLSSIQKVAAAMSGINPDDVEIIGAPSTLTKEEREKLPIKTINELSSQSNFIGRAFASVKEKLGL